MLDEKIDCLISNLISGQDDLPDIPVKSREYWERRFFNLSEADRILLAISPANRLVFEEAWIDRRAQKFQDIVANDNKPKLRAAASSRSRDSITFDLENADLNLTFEPVGSEDWQAILRTNNPHQFSGIRMKLIELSSGRIILNDFFDDQGYINGIWPLKERPDAVGFDFLLMPEEEI
ncbi:hypothetical protein [Donghicola eburneus]|uniref:Uncharacterized protein n=1 Tax=Donghicola eburneus TaxID=393278 RepID=A0A1M4MXH1_9RHOB|nr:hypothetical protein [Donghicola eburneus]SCM66448.1 hypothetical protein KARMA_0624 [Donghicola eburneus]